MFSRILGVVWVAGLAMLDQASVAASEPSLRIEIAGKVSTFTASQLSKRVDAAQLSISLDPAYNRPVTYRAVPLLSLLGAPGLLTFDTLEARATDGYVSQMPTALIMRGRQGGAVAWIAVEPPDKPWPKLPKKSVSPGPFYLVWQFPERSNIGSAYWPYALAELTAVRSPMQRWPKLRVEATVEKDAPERRGMHQYIKHCLACHKIGGAGEATMGPDLLLPMNPFDYMTRKGLRALIRNPSALRIWPKQQMTGFSSDILPEQELDDLLAYLKYMASK